MSFDRAFQITVGVEGGYVNDPADPGGETKYGISHRAYPDIDIKALTLDQAKDIYRRDYWQAASCDSMPERIGHLVFDCAVHHGVKTAIKLLQRALKVADDGEFGPITRGTLTARDTNETADLLMAQRMLYLMTCSAWPTYKLGWAKRCFSVARAA
jgi:lysozyme family protein